MCGRFFVDAKNREIDRLLELLPSNSLPVRTGDVFPSNSALVLAKIEDAQAPQSMKWGFPRKDGNGVIFNARSETALVKPLFKKALQKNPLVVPASGFYEWQAIPGQKHKEKYLFNNPDSLLWLAGFWNAFTDNDNHTLPYFTILTTQANPSVKPFHERMPVILEHNQIEAWLNGDGIAEMLRKTPGALQVTPCQ